jgi:hypothetical protein
VSWIAQRQLKFCAEAHCQIQFVTQSGVRVIQKLWFDVPWPLNTYCWQLFKRIKRYYNIFLLQFRPSLLKTAIEIKSRLEKLEGRPSSSGLLTEEQSLRLVLMSALSIKHDGSGLRLLISIHKIHHNHISYFISCQINDSPQFFTLQ